MNTQLLKRQRGFSLVEIMIAVTLSLIVLAGVLAVMYSSKVTYNENERVGRLQESGRAALEFMLRDLRGSGFPGCAQPIAGLFQLNNTLTSPTALLWNFAQPVYGHEYTGAAWVPAINAAILPSAAANNDIVVVRTVPAGAPAMRVSSAVAPTAASITVQKEEGDMLQAGVPLVISDCGNASVFVPSAFTADATDKVGTITRVAGAGTPSNASLDLGATYGPGARVAPLTTVIYYIRAASSGTGNSLWRVRSNLAPEELVPGVQAMQVLYGVANAGQMQIASYVTANNVTDWSRVISVNFALLMRSAEPNSPTLDNKVYSLLGVNHGAYNDRYQRALFTTTVTLRNRTN